MDSGKKNFIVKTWKRCRSFPHGGGSSGVGGGLPKSKSWSGSELKKKKMKKPPEGFFPVYVGPEKQRFAIKTKYANHPLFTMLLEDAETEYGYHCDGPILLPCDVGFFYDVLVQMEAKDVQVRPLGCGFGHGSCSPFDPRRRLRTDGGDLMGNGYGSYEILTHNLSVDENCLI